MGVLSDSSVLPELAALLGSPPGKAGEILDATVQVLKNSLLKNHRLDLDDFISLQIVEEKARLVQFQNYEARVIQGPRNSLVSSPIGTFEEELAQVKLAPILLVAPRDDLFAQVIVHHFTQEGWEVRLIHDTDGAAAALDGHATCLVILDTSLPDAQGLLDRIKLQRKTNAVPVVAFFSRGHDPQRPKRLRIRADQEIAEPFEVLVLLSLAARELARSSEEELLFDHQVQFVLPSTQADLDRATRLATTLFGDSGLEPDGQTALSTAFREAVGNAIQHGNGREPAKIVEVQYLQDPRRITIVVRDEGDGFDPRPYLQQADHKDAAGAARARRAQGGQGGLGILMIRRCTDSVEYSSKGNAVTLTKHLPAPEPSFDTKTTEIAITPIHSVEPEREIDLSGELGEGL